VSSISSEEILSIEWWTQGRTTNEWLKPVMCHVPSIQDPVDRWD